MPFCLSLAQPRRNSASDTYTRASPRARQPSPGRAERRGHEPGRIPVAHEPLLAWEASSRARSGLDAHRRCPTGRLFMGRVSLLHARLTQHGGCVRRCLVPCPFCAQGALYRLRRIARRHTGKGVLKSNRACLQLQTTPHRTTSPLLPAPLSTLNDACTPVLMLALVHITPHIPLNDAAQAQSPSIASCSGLCWCVTVTTHRLL